MGGLITSPVAWTRTLHILFAVWAATGIFASTVAFALVKRTSDAAGRQLGLRFAWKLTTTYTVPGVVLAGLLGFYQVTASRIGFGPGWVRASAVVYLALLAIVLLVQVPALRRAQAGAPLSPAVAMLTHVDALLILILIFLMSFKPF